MRVLLLVVATVGLGQVPGPKIERAAPEQPLPFQHKKHAAAGLKCQQCHTMPGDGEMATLPATAVCMACHTQIKKDGAAILKLTEYHKDWKKNPWSRVNRVPDYL